MTRKDQTAICQFARQKVPSAIARVEASVNRVKPYQVDKQDTPQELEPYDALSDRFVRAVETSIKFFRSYEILMFAETSETLRDQLNRMEKLNLITETSTGWRCETLGIGLFTTIYQKISNRSTKRSGANFQTNSFL